MSAAIDRYCTGQLLGSWGEVIANLNERTYPDPPFGKLALVIKVNPRNTPALQHRMFLFVLFVVTLAFGWVLLPFFGAVFWGVVLAILFQPLHRWLLPRVMRSSTVSAIVTLVIILFVVILPVVLIASSLSKEAMSIVKQIQSGGINLERSFAQILSVLPDWLSRQLDSLGLRDISELQAQLAKSAASSGRAIATQVFSIGQNTVEFIVSLFIALYLAFFMLRDGRAMARTIYDAIPLDTEIKHAFFSKFATAIRATVKGNLVVALVQGCLGGIAFWFLGIHAAMLWAVLMAFLSLLPAVGPALVWLPVALYLLGTGAVWQAVALIAWGLLVIGVIDNVLRPILVGKDTRMPDYMVLMSTLGGLSLFGLSGFVIGPVIAAMFVSAWTSFATVRQHVE